MNEIRKRLAIRDPVSTIQPMKRITMLVAILLAGCSSPPDIHETRFMMGTLVEFTISGVDKNVAMPAIQAATAEMQRVDNMFTIYGTAPNPVKALNNEQVGHPFPLPKEISRVLRTALQIQQKSGGLFDPALGKLDLLWGFSLPDPRTTPPSDQQIRNAIPPKTCFTEVDAGWIRQNQRCALDFGAIAKGYAIDRGMAALQSHGIRNAIINAGGDLRMIGSHNGKPWRIGIRHPRKPDAVLATLEMHGDASIVTSGDYERFFIYDGRRYHHILNPKTGYPAMLSQSATVIAPNATLADGWSTALFVEGPAGIKSLARRNGFAAMLVDRNGKLHMTDNMRKISHLP